MSETTEHHPLLKPALEIGPLAVFFLSFQWGREILEWGPVAGFLGTWAETPAMTGDSGPLFVATALFMVAISASLAASWWLTRALPRMAVVTAIVVVVFGGLTLWLQDETFIKMKPTIVNGLFALALGIGLLQGRSYIRYLMAEALSMDDRGWMIFTQRWCAFFVFMALLNEAVWRTQSTEFWVSFKTFANVPITLVFMLLQVPLIQKHMIEEPEAGE
ncbi:MAG: septation protein A [Pseudomonadota bacterium]